MPIQVCVIIAAAGCGSRMGGINKVLQPLGGRPVLTWSLALFEQSDAVGEILIAAAPDQLEAIRALAAPYAKVKAVVAGGLSRAASVGQALAVASPQMSHIAVHDAARPLLAADDWQALLQAAETAPGGVILAQRPSDSIKNGSDGLLTAALDRSRLVLAQTPQLFPAGLLRNAYTAAAETLDSATDEAELVAQTGAQIRYLLAAAPNFKLTFPADLALAEAELQRRGQLPAAGGLLDGLPALPALNQALSAAPAGCSLGQSGLRLGLGWDIHRLVEGKPLLLGGVRIPYHLGLLGHSDADVLLHALIDALLGAAALGDIGSHFPDHDPRFRDADSRLLLSRTHQLLTEAGWQIVNLDATVIAQQPRLLPYQEQIRQSIATALGLPLNAVAIKAKTAEGLGEIGQNRAIAAQALAVIRG